MHAATNSRIAQLDFSKSIMHGEAPTASLSLRHSVPLHISLSRLPSASVRLPSLPFPLHSFPATAEAGSLLLARSFWSPGRLLACCKASQQPKALPFAFTFPSGPSSLLFLPFLLFHFFHPSFAFLAATVANIAAHLYIFHSPRPPFHRNRLAFRIHRCLTSAALFLRLERRSRHNLRLLGVLFFRAPPHPRLPLKSEVLRRCLVLAS